MPPKQKKIVKTDWGYEIYDISKPTTPMQIGASVGKMFTFLELSKAELDQLDKTGECMFVEKENE